MGYWDGKVVLVTGGSSGFGYALSSALVGAGADVVLVARDAGRLESAVERLRATGHGGHGILGIPADVTEPADVQRLFAQLRGEKGKLDALFNIAGRSDRGMLLETPADRLRELWELNVLAALRCAGEGRELLSQSRGHLVFMGSLAAKSAARYLGGYCCTKFPLAAAAQQLRLELEPERIHVLLVCPGPIARADAGVRYEQQAAGLPESARKPGGGVRLRGIEPAWLAEKVLAACEKRRAELVVPGKARILFALSQLWPTWGDAIIRKSQSD
jgi:uncharacterized protein